MKKIDEKETLIISVFVVFTVLIGAVGFSFLTSDVSEASEVKTFSSYDELKQFLKENRQASYHPGFSVLESGNIRQSGSDSSNGAITAPSGDAVGSDYSETNIQVEGVDEPDIVKTDGTNLFVVANNSVFIIHGYPGEAAEVISSISFDEEMYITSLFIHENRLIVFGESNRLISFKSSNYENISSNKIKKDEESIESENSSKNEDKNENLVPMPKIYPYWSISSTIVKVYDISSMSEPELVKSVSFDGHFFDARLINDDVYIIATEYTYDVYRRIDEHNESFAIPQITVDNKTKTIPSENIHYVDIAERIDTMTHVVSIDLTTNTINQESFMLGASQNIYVSLNAIYLAYTQYQYNTMLLEDDLSDKDISSSHEVTVIHKIAIQNGDISYETKGDVLGRVLNQFSMDEHNGYFRIATTIGQSWDESNPSTNNVFILDDELNLVSSIEDIASGESIYAARFMGDRAYLVTFKKIDPFFTLDLSDPLNPQLLGELKIPGYSDYLHPFDEHHVIGIGKDTVAPVEELEWTNNFVWYQGVKIALFNVSDFSNPTVTDQVVIGDRGTSSPALYDHKAFLFDKEKELLVIPISLYEISNETKKTYETDPGAEYGKFTFQGAYVYNVSLDGFSYKGRITHRDNEDYQNEYYNSWYRSSSHSISRSLFINEYLYTISDKMVKINVLSDLSELASLNLD